METKPKIKINETKFEIRREKRDIEKGTSDP